MTSSSENASDAICIFISSSDRTCDVFLRTFAHFDRMWPTCPFRKFVGLTTETAAPSLLGFSVVPSAGEAGWPHELADQIRALPGDISFVLLLLDDFLLLEPVDEVKVARTVGEAIRRNLSYVRLKPVDRSLFVAMLRRARKFIGAPEVHRLSNNEPYFSSLQASLWKRDHLLASLEKAETIWHFEHLALAGVPHWAVARPVLHYRHVVERGIWQPYAAALFARVGVAFDPGKRPVRTSVEMLHHMWQKLKFGLIGFSGMRLKRTLTKHVLRPVSRRQVRSDQRQR
jgi:hypothetical protein